jgi:cytochrome b subunit of formate dehydrogenase
VHRQIIKGKLWEQENHKLPVCVECHSPHEARRVQYDTGVANADCLFCHAKPDLVAASDGHSLHVDLEEYEASVHGRDLVACAQCHTGVDPANKERPCAANVEKVDCAICHEAVVSSYSSGIHGQLHARGDPNAPYCTDCHGRHNMLEHGIADDTPAILKDVIRDSPTYSRNVPALCARCHREGATAARRYLGPESDIIKHYTMSIHGKGLLESGLTVTAICTNCHTAHKELDADDPESTVHKDNIAATCGRCHDGIYEQYEASIHSPSGNPDYVQLRDMPHLPRCSDCHSSHTVARTDLPDFKLGVIEECGECHEDVTERYFETFHGKASELGDAAKAKCYDCHGAHDILPTEDPASHLHRDNIVATCGKCHPGSHRQFAGYLTHATHHDPDKYPTLFYAFWGMTTLLVGTFGFFAIHTIAWFPRSLKWRREIRRAVAAAEVKTGKHVVRFTSYQRKLHLMIIISFFGLAITGMMLKFSYTPWAQVLARILGGAESAGFIHRVCAIITFAYFGLHLWDLYARFRRGRQSLKCFLLGPDSMLPKLSDIREFGQTLKWFVGLGPRPRYGRWTYWEKFDYFAVFWGIAIIGSTGLCLWFPEIFTRLLPGWSINVATIIHSDEALLATGFIFTIHFFNSHFRPEKFPMDDVIFTGTVPLEELKHDRPRWYEELVQRGELEQLTVEEPHTPRFEHAVKILGFSALAIGVVLIILIIYAMLFAYR